MENKALLQVENLSVFFNSGTFCAVNDVSFSIGRGEVLGLVGESGSGKTTTGRAVIGLQEFSKGIVRFNGEVLRQAKKRSKKRYEPKIQMIFQDPVSSLNPRMTVREIVSEGLIIRGVKDKALISSKVADVLKKVGLRPEYAERYPHEFSGGQRQRIGIARAIIMEPELIIADEPVSALDVSIKAQIINLLDELRRDMGLTILFIAHDLSIVKYFSDRIAVMYAGRIVELAESAELFAYPLHPYTKSLLSAIPLPDPLYEKQRKRIVYEPNKAHDYSNEEPVMQEVRSGHFVLCSKAEYEGFINEVKA